MNIVPAFLLVALGIALHALHIFICRRAENNAWSNGYSQAAKEEQIRLTTEEKVKKLAPPSAPALPFRSFSTMQHYPTTEKPTGYPTVSQSFMDDLHANGRAAVRLK